MGLRRSLQLSEARAGALRVVSSLLTLASGFCGLSYQVAWTQQCGSWLGHESAAVLAVVAAFFGGTSLGSLAFAKPLEKTSQPARWYAGCELTIGLWSALLAVLLPRFGAAVLELIGVRPSPLWQWVVTFLATFLLFLPATAAMGATLPAMERIVAGPTRDRRSLAALYASNTFGAVLGALLTGSYLIEKLGLARTSLVCAGLNVGCAVAAGIAFPAQIQPSVDEPVRAGDVPSPRPLVSLAGTGLLGIGYEVLVVRVLSQVTEGTVYTFAALLAVYLVGSAAGAAIYQRWLAPRRAAERLGDWLLAALAGGCVGGIASLWSAEATRAAAQDAFGEGTTRAIVAEAAPALLAFGVPTLLMGATFSHFCGRAKSQGTTFGTAVGVNTLGAALSPALFGVLLASELGPKLALTLIPIGYLALCSMRSWRRPLVLAPAAASLLLAAFAPPLAFVELPEGARVVRYEDGLMAAVSVVEDADGVSRLRINNRAQEGSSATQRVDGRQAWLPLLLHPSPGRVLFLGLGTGVTASFAAFDPTLRVDAVELLPEVIHAAELFAPSVGEGAPFRKLNVLAADARRYVRATDRAYDLIVADNFHPARSGSGALYTVEHFDAVRQRLEPRGLFCQWLPLHQLDSRTLRSIVKSFLAVYPAGSALIASGSLETPVLGLIGGRDATRFDVPRLGARLARLTWPEVTGALGLEDEFAVLGSFVAGPASLERFSAEAPLNTDDHPIVTYRAPSVTYSPDSSAADRFIALLRELRISPSEVVAPSTDPAWAERLVAYFRARNLFIESGRHVRPSANVVEMLAQVREPLLAVLRISPDFRPAYDPLLAMASARAGSDVSDARRLLKELSRLQPARHDAAQLLGVLASAPAAAAR